MSEMLTYHDVYLSIGSNLGNSAESLVAAIRQLREHTQIKVMHVSQFYKTEPLSLKQQNQPWYLNACVHIESSLSPIKLLRFTQDIENSFGRIRLEKWGPRTLDIDLLFYDDLIQKSSDLTLPHPELDKRRFVLEPLAEIAATKIHPIRGLSVQDLLKKSKDSKKVIPLYKVSLTFSQEVQDQVIELKKL